MQHTVNGTKMLTYGKLKASYLDDIWENISLLWLYHLYMHGMCLNIIIYWQWIKWEDWSLCWIVRWNMDVIHGLRYAWGRGLSLYFVNKLISYIQLFNHHCSIRVNVLLELLTAQLRYIDLAQAQNELQ